MYERARSIFAQALGARHARVAITDNNLGEVYQKLGRSVDAERAWASALAAFEATLGPEHPYVAYPLANLGQLRVTQGRRAEAVPLLERALAIREKALPANHPEVIGLRQTLAKALAKGAHST